MQNLLNKKVLVTTSNWFYGPDGKQYRAVWGTLLKIHEAGKALGFIPNRAHANWFVEVGNLVIMGCQVMYVLQCDTEPNVGNAKDWHLDAGACKEYDRPGAIYLAQDPERKVKIVGYELRDSL